jgi:hypothetical protein
MTAAIVAQHGSPSALLLAVAKSANSWHRNCRARRRAVLRVSIRNQVNQRGRTLYRRVESVRVRLPRGPAAMWGSNPYPPQPGFRFLVSYSAAGVTYDEIPRI